MELSPLLALVLVAFSVSALAGEIGQAPDSGGGAANARFAAADILRTALDDASIRSLEPRAQLDSLSQAAKRASDMLEPSQLATQRLNLAIHQAGTHSAATAEKSVSLLLASMNELEKDLSFQLQIEADRPIGFPVPTPVGEVEVKSYPKHRKAQAETPPNAAFWTLFSHIERNDIAMTAPVEMQYGVDSESSLRQEAMSFLYGDPGLGELGRDGSVLVMDIPSMTVISTGVRGPQTEHAVENARQRLEMWLQANRNKWAAATPLRIMAHNSPFIPKDQNYFEVQIPIRSLAEEPAASVSNRSAK